jgi:catechol 2,3-dioxygenase-like lactoylglutathione lyase family enzyme
MSHDLDHIVHAVRDLDAAAEFYSSAGFTVGARNRHPWGTHNRIVQFPGFFIELITVGEPGLIPMPSRGSFSFGGFTRDFLARGEGLSMLVLEGKGAAADVAAFHQAGIGHFDEFDFERDAKRPDGSTVKVGFSLAFATDPNAPDVGYFTCQQHYPENFWNPAFQTHPNGAAGIAGVTMVAENPADHAAFFRAFSGVSDVTSNSNGIAIKTLRGEIQVMDSTAYRQHFVVEPPDLTRGARLAAIRLSLHDKAALVSALGKGGIVPAEHMGNVIIPPDAAHGATLIFEAPKKG